MTSGKRARDENFFDTVEAMEDRRAVVKESMHVDQMGLLSKAQETEDKMLTMMERQDEVSAQRHGARMNCRSGARSARMSDKPLFRMGFWKCFPSNCKQTGLPPYSCHC
ncbi:hypothetical protein NQZ68_035360 [Dissostichus eleginoides]|nr:hypothetical protein NQZ68_035360 [Dissostichus eleginoides]